MSFLNATYLSVNSFTVAEDITALAHCGRRAILDLNGSYVVSSIWKSVYGAPNTTVYLEESIATSALGRVAFGPGARATQQLPNHYHSNVEGDGSQFECRMEMEYNSTASIKIKPGAYMLYSSDGSIDRVMYNNAELTFTFGSGGSNAGSDALPTSGMIYLFLDESVCKAQASRALVAGCFIGLTTAPTFSNTKKQWLNSNDRCVWGIPTDSSANIRLFYQDKTKIDYRNVDNAYDVANGVDIDTAWVPLTVDIPAFSVDAIISLLVYNSGSAVTFDNALYRVTGSSDTGNRILHGHDLSEFVITNVKTSIGQQIDIKFGASDTDVLYSQTYGFSLPSGM